MLSVDFIGMILTIIFTGLRYPHLAICGALVHEAGKILMSLAIYGQADFVVMAGIFGNFAVDSTSTGCFISAISGPLANYMVLAFVRGKVLEKPFQLMNPLAYLSHPFAVINARFAVLSLFLNLWNLF